MFFLKQTWDNGKNNWPHSFLSRPRLLVVMLNIEIHIQAINACLKCINNSIMLKFNLGNHLLQIIYSTALLDHKPSSVKKMEIWPALPFVHISITQHAAELTQPSPFWEQSSLCLQSSDLPSGGCDTAQTGGISRMEMLQPGTKTQPHLNFVTPEFALSNSVLKGNMRRQSTLCVSHVEAVIALSHHGAWAPIVLSLKILVSQLWW